MISDNARTVLTERYLLKDEKGETIETVDQMWNRVAKAVSASEGTKDRKQWNEAFYNMMASLRFLPNSPTLMNAGAPHSKGTLSGCFVVPIDDTMSSLLEPDKFGIMEAVRAAALIQKFGGGCGFSLSRLRGTGEVIRSTHGKACGPVGVLHELNETANLVTQGGKRKGANMGVLRVDHPDIRTFIYAKEKHGVLPNFNISVGLTDEFMKAVEDGSDLILRDPRNKKKAGTVPARQLYDEIVKLMHTNGEPGVIFIDSINRNNPVPHIGEVESTNPCGEQPLLPFESCNLGSINLARHLKDGEIDWELLTETVRTAVRFLDDVIDVNAYPLKEIENVTKQTRKVGLGVMGFADMLSFLGIPYDSAKGVKTGREVMRHIQREAIKYSEELAEERGPFPAYKKNAVVPRPRRNATLTTIAPTGTLSKIANCSAGVEPHFGIAYEAIILDGKHLKFVCSSLADKVPITDSVMDKIIENGGSVQGIKEIPRDVQKAFPIAQDIKPEWHIKMLAAFQEYTCNAVSKTINLPKDTTIEGMKSIIVEAYTEGCKGLTVYRLGSRPEQVILLPNGELGLPEDMWVKPKRRPKETVGTTKIVNVGECGELYITVNRDKDTGEIVEIFGQPASETGGCQSLINALGKMTSLMLRAGVNPEYVANKLRVQYCHACGPTSGAEARSCSDAMYRFLIQELGAEMQGYQLGAPKPKSHAPECPSCKMGILMLKSATCRKCNVCGYETCGGG